MVLQEYLETYETLISRLGPHEAAGADNFKMSKDTLTKAGYKAGLCVLDYGCGWGSLLEVIDDYDSYEGIDISYLMVNEAKKRYPNKNFYVSSIGKLKTGKKYFIIAHSVFTHVPKSIVHKALRDIASNMASVAVIDIFYGDAGDGYFEYYHHEEWLQLLESIGLKGEFIESRTRHEPYRHYYYKVTHG